MVPISGDLYGHKAQLWSSIVWIQTSQTELGQKKLEIVRAKLCPNSVNTVNFKIIGNLEIQQKQYFQIW